MQGVFFLDIVIGQCSAVLKLCSGKDQPLLGRNALFLLYFLFDVFNGVVALHFQRDRFAGQRAHEDLHGEGVDAQRRGQRENENQRDRSFGGTFHL